MAVNEPYLDMARDFIIQRKNSITDPVDLGRTECERLHTADRFTRVKAEFHETDAVLVCQGVIITEDFAPLTRFKGP